jgi:hypothetical protein
MDEKKNYNLIEENSLLSHALVYCVGGLMEKYSVGVKKNTLFFPSD